MRSSLLIAMAAAGCLSAQAPPADIMPLMQEIVQGLGVQCEYCHSAPRGSGEPEPKKDIARQMIAMTRDLNTRVQTATGKPAPQAVVDGQSRIVYARTGSSSSGSGP